MAIELEQPCLVTVGISPLGRVSTRHVFGNASLCVVGRPNRFDKHGFRLAVANIHHVEEVAHYGHEVLGLFTGEAISLFADYLQHVVEHVF